MRLPLVSNIDSRDGTANKDERLTNVLMENDEGVAMACVRPGLATIATASGVGGGETVFNETLITVFGTTLGFGATPATISTVVAGNYDFCQSPI